MLSPSEARWVVSKDTTITVTGPKLWNPPFPLFHCSQAAGEDQSVSSSIPFLIILPVIAFELCVHVGVSFRILF